MITTSNPELARRLRLLRSHGMTINSWDRDKGRPAEYDVAEFGFNFRLDDIRAALGLAQLRKLEQINEKRRQLSDLYTHILSTLEPELILPFASLPANREPSFHIYPVLFPSREERNEMEELLRERGIQTSIHYKPIHWLSAFADIDPNLSLPVTEEFAARELTLPLYPGMMESHIDTVVSAMVQCRLRLV
jgi:dTDP-4-amino-4,6-dideoxygalactose transaminase